MKYAKLSMIFAVVAQITVLLYAYEKIMMPMNSTQNLFYIGLTALVFSYINFIRSLALEYKKDTTLWIILSLAFPTLTPIIYYCIVRQKSANINTH
jgi:hypothetical protein